MIRTSTNVDRVVWRYGGLRGEVGIGFDPSYPAAAAIIRRDPLRFVDDLTATQQEAIREALARAFETGLGTRATARSFRASLHLTVEQREDIANYRSLLERGSDKALSLSLRDRRFDRSVSKAVKSGKPLPMEKIERMVERYTQVHLADRAECIAQTESVRATSQARHEALQHMVRTTGIDPTRVSRIWHTTKDDRARAFHAVMDGQTVGLEEPFVDGKGNRLLYPGDPDGPAETVCRCRCVVAVRIGPPTI